MPYVGVQQIDADYKPVTMETRTIFGLQLQQRRNDAVIDGSFFGNIVSRSKEVSESLLMFLTQSRNVRYVLWFIVEDLVLSLMGVWCGCQCVSGFEFDGCLVWLPVGVWCGYQWVCGVVVSWCLVWCLMYIR